MVKLTHVDAPGEMRIVRALFEEYASSLDIDLCFQGFDIELETLPGAYAPPDGTIVIARVDGEPVGCVALRRIEEGVCEMKRLYVVPAHRRKGVGRALADEVIAYARSRGYALMKLDTLESMTEANDLYRSLGFVPCGAYRYNPCPGPVFMELALS